MSVSGAIVRVEGLVVEPLIQWQSLSCGLERGVLRLNTGWTTKSIVVVCRRGGGLWRSVSGLPANTKVWILGRSHAMKRDNTALKKGGRSWIEVHEWDAVGRIEAFEASVRPEEESGGGLRSHHRFINETVLKCEHFKTERIKP